MASPDTCQICGRTIKLVGGMIAHHGFQRPGTGWQTASCMGAREQSYRASRNFIPVAIKQYRKMMLERQKSIQMLDNNPDIPEVFFRNRKHVGDPVILTVADGHRYAREKNSLLRSLKSEVSQIQDQLKYLANRFNSWKAEA